MYPFKIKLKGENMNNSLRNIFIIISLTGLILLVTSFTILDNSQNKDDKYTALLHKVDSLSNKVSNLEKRVQKLEDQKLAFTLPKPYFHVPGGKVPPDWKEYKYKGKPYYIVPLQNEIDAEIQKLKNK